ncbi:hypothetical protein B0H15DRAFT_85349 [Mycena belliarum]|uniref:Uncharacterized protein n=1 Tax=Mycena belliarum TaxID=1033014 RepID=A0AAD6TP99_9AGAR|nr:hypothetical protein B0H15DRAFT_85349 [Mycena belliae]
MRGACHSEAGLMAAILSGMKSNDDAQLESAAELRMAIGVAKKCCPICRMLSEQALEQYDVHVELPGRHSRYHPWVAPHWLPRQITAELESRLILIVHGMTKHMKDLHSSRSSSPSSDRSDSEDEDEGDTSQNHLDAFDSYLSRQLGR